MKVINSLLLCFYVLALSSCKDNTQNIEDTSEAKFKYFHFEDSEWKSDTHNQKADDINYTATEVPIPYYQLKNIAEKDPSKIDSIYEATKTERIIEFEFLQEEEKDLLDEKFSNKNYKETIEYISFQMEKDFYVVTSKNDTINCSGIIYERSFKVAPQQKVLLFFSNIPANDKIQLVYNDRLFGKGILKFKFDENNTPTLL